MIQNLLNKTKVIHLLYSLIIAIVGFGSCIGISIVPNIGTFSNPQQNLMFIPGVLHLISGVFSISSLYAVNKRNPETQELYHSRSKRILIVLAGIPLTLWSFFWGIASIILSLGTLKF